jgi:hypothetical protein
MPDDRVPYSEDEAREAWLWVNRHGPSNAWTAGAGTAARMIGRLLKERERLLALIAQREERAPYWLQPHD